MQDYFPFDTDAVPTRTTLLELVATVSEMTTTDTETAAVINHMLLTRLVSLRDSMDDEDFEFCLN